MNSLTAVQVVTTWAGMKPKWNMYRAEPARGTLLKYLQMLLDAGVIFEEVVDSSAAFVDGRCGVIKAQVGGKQAWVRVHGYKNVRIIEAHLHKGVAFFEAVIRRDDDQTEVALLNDVLSALVD